MPVVPLYEDRGVRLDPGMNFRDGTRASGDMFGAQIGEALGNVGHGMKEAATTIAQAREFDDVSFAKDAHNKLMPALRNLQYGADGFMGKSGGNAVSGFSSFQARINETIRKYGEGLSPGALRKYMDAANASAEGVFSSAMVHVSNERKSWAIDLGNARIAEFANNALVNYGNPDEVNKNIAAGIMELRSTLAAQGHPAEYIRQKELDYSSGTHKNIALRIAQSDAIKAQQYIDANRKFLSGADQYELQGSVGKEAEAAEDRDAALQFLSGQARTFDDAPEEATAAATGGTASRPGPTRDKAVLLGKLAACHRADHVTNLDGAFATNLAALFQDAPEDIRKGLGIGSGYRSNERQIQLFENSDKTGKWVAFPQGYVKPNGQVARGSNHTHGTAVDLTYNGARLDKAPQAVIDYVHQNAARYGLRFPMGYEPWHVEPVSDRAGAGTVVASSDRVTARSSMPSYSDIEKYLLTIPDPKRRDRVRQTIGTMMELRTKQEEQNQKAAKAELFRFVETGNDPDDAPFDLKMQAGMDAITSARNYYAKTLEGPNIPTDEVLLRDMRLYAASNPDEFAKLDINDYRDRLSKSDARAMDDLKVGIINDARKAREEGVNITTAFAMAKDQLEAVGIPTSGDRDAEDKKNLAEFQNSLYAEMGKFEKDNPGKKPTPTEIYGMISTLLLRGTIKTPRSSFNPASWVGSSTSNKEGWLFQARKLPEGSTWEFTTKITDVPAQLRDGIKLNLEQKLGYKPSDAEVVREYLAFLMHQPSPSAGAREEYAKRVLDQQERERVLGSRRDW